jgi:hypothetical protein
MFQVNANIIMVEDKASRIAGSEKKSCIQITSALVFDYLSYQSRSTKTDYYFFFFNQTLTILNA